MGKLEDQIKITKQVIKDGKFKGKWILNETELILENHLVILETLKDLVTFKN